MKHQDIQDLLRDHAAGKLTADESALLMEYLADDPDLARFAGFVEWLEPRLAQLAATDQGAHPSGQELVAAALGPLPELPGNDSAAVHDHIAQCPECQELVSAIKAADTAPLNEPVVLRRRQPGWQKMAIAAVLAVAVIGTGLFIGRPSQSPLPAPIRLAAVTRSAPVETTITALVDHRIPPLLLTLDPWIGRQNADNYTLQVTLSANDQPDLSLPYLSIAARDWQPETGGIVVNWPQKNLPPGHYRIEVRDDRDHVIFQTLFQLIPHAE